RPPHPITSRIFCQTRWGLVARGSPAILRTPLRDGTITYHVHRVPRSLHMGILQQLSGFAMQNVVGAALKTAGVEAAEQVVNLFNDRRGDHSRRLGRALAQAGQRAWQVLELALAGDGFWQRCRQVFARGEVQSLGRQVQALLAAPLADITDPELFRHQCLRELQAARKAGLLGPDRTALPPLTRFADPQAVLDAERQTLAGVAAHLRR